MRTLMVIFCSVMLVGLVGCNNIRNRDVGTAVGAGTGALVGGAISHGNVAATVGGAVVGGVAGHYIGKKTEKK
ncbi:MAG: glycine zipper domain-containing protein [Gammaproteobacteria bacterium]